MPDADEQKILDLPAVQNELAYQREDVETLSGAAKVSDVIEEMRTRAHRNRHNQAYEPTRIVKTAWSSPPDAWRASRRRQ